MSGRVWGYIKVLVTVLVSVPLVPAQILMLLVAPNSRAFFFLPRIWNRFAAWMLGLKVTVVGDMTPQRPVMVVANHLGYVDIIALSAYADGFFIAKHEVKTWPVFGWLAMLRGTRFVRRDPKYVRGQRSALQDDFDRGRSLILFPEGTSTDGTTVRPFKSSLFEAVVGSSVPVVVQPVVLVLDRVDGRPIDDPPVRNRVAWYDDTGLVPHIGWLLKRRSIEMRLIWLPSFPATPGEHRKRVTDRAWRAVAEGLARALPPEVAAAAAARPPQTADADPTEAAA